MAVLWVTFKKLSPLQWQYPAFLPLALHFFALGILSRAFFPLLSRIRLWIFPLVFAASFIVPHSVRSEVVIWGLFLGAALIEFRLARRETSGNRIFEATLCAMTSNRIARSLGECSYSTYLIHIPLFSLFGWAVAQATGEWNQRLCGISTVAAIFALVPISFLLYRIIENRFVRIGADIAKSRISGALKAG